MIYICSKKKKKKSLELRKDLCAGLFAGSQRFEPRWTTSARSKPNYPARLHQEVPLAAMSPLFMKVDKPPISSLFTEGTVWRRGSQQNKCPVVRFRIKFHVYVSVLRLPSSTLPEKQILMYGWWKKWISGNQVTDGGKEIHKCFISRCHFVIVSLKGCLFLEDDFLHLDPKVI